MNYNFIGINFKFFYVFFIIFDDILCFCIKRRDKELPAYHSLQTKVCKVLPPPLTCYGELRK